MIMPIVVALSLFLDAVAGEPPSKLHPVVWMGNYVAWMKKRNTLQNWQSFWQGFGLLALGLLGLSLVTGLLLFFLRTSPTYLATIWLALLLKPMFSVRSLLDAGESVKQALELNNLPEARRLLAWHLVSRDTSELTEEEVAGAAVSSLAENITDSIIAPLFYFALFGLMGAVLYRFLNTADAMLGYRTEQLEYFGKAAAKLDDVLNFIPARLTSVLLFVLFIAKKDAFKGLFVARKATVPSPNGAWTMGMVAGGLNICLEKKDVYSLNDSGEAASAHSISLVQNLIIAVTALFVLISFWWHYAY